MYPPGWPKCKGCGKPALDGKATCGDVACLSRWWENDERKKREEAPITRHPGITCECGNVLDSCMEVPGQKSDRPRPKENDTAICFECGRVFRFNADMSLRPATSEEAAELPPNVASVVADIRARATVPPAYEAACRLTEIYVQRFKPLAPLFAFAPADVLLIAPITVGHRLARNAAAHILIDELIAASKRAALPDVPTVTMLRATLELLEVPFQTVPLADLGITLPTGEN